MERQAERKGQVEREDKSEVEILSGDLK